jgi:osmoprotectant transport system permease protein
VGTATIAAAIGAGGLGEYIFRGLSMVDTTTILAGAIPAAVLALGVDSLLGGIERALNARRRPSFAMVPVLTAAGALVVFAAWVGQTAPATHVTVGSKNFTEQIILGELAAQAVEAEGLPVARKLNLGGTFICDRALKSGDIDLYVEYTGTAVTAVFHENVPHDPRRALERARARYAAEGLTLFEPLGFNDTFAILVRSQDARALDLHTIDDLRRVAQRWRPGFGYEFLQRADGYPGLIQAYGLTFGVAPRAMDLSLIYKALADRQVDVIAGDTTSALVDALDLTRLEDTRQYFPPYDAVPVVRTPVALERPQIRRAMKRLAGHISEADMRALNRAVDIDRQDPGVVARAFLAKISSR